MTLPSQSQFDSTLTKTDLAEIFKCRKIRTTGALLRIRSSREAAAARQPDRMGQRHSLRPVRPRSRPGPLATGPYVVFLQQSGRYPALQRLLCPAADALLRDAEAAGDSGLAEALIVQAQGSQAAAFESFEIAFDSSRMTHAY